MLWVGLQLAGVEFQVSKLVGCGVGTEGMRRVEGKWLFAGGALRHTQACTLQVSRGVRTAKVETVLNS